MDISQFNQQINSCKQEYETLTKRTGQVEKESFQMLQARVNSLADVIERSEVDFPKNLQFTFGVACIEINDLAKKLQEYAKKHFDSDLDIHSPFAVNLYSSLKIEKKKTPETSKRVLLTQEAPDVKRAQESLKAEKLKMSETKAVVCQVLGITGIIGSILGFASIPILIPFFVALGPPFVILFATLVTFALCGGVFSALGGGAISDRRQGLEEKEKNLKDAVFLTFAEEKGYTSSQDLLNQSLHDLFRRKNELKKLENPRNKDSYVKYKRKNDLENEIKSLEEKLPQNRKTSVQDV